MTTRPGATRTSNVAPFLSRPGSGYANYLSKVDHGEWYHMLSPGQHGYGLMVTYHAPESCCYPAEGAPCTYTAKSMPWLLPALVEWRSPTDPKTLAVHRAILEMEDDDGYGVEADEITFPPLLIENHHTLDRGWKMMWANSVTNAAALFDDSGIYVAGGPTGIEAFCAPWQVLPLDKPMHDAIKVQMDVMSDRYHTWALEFSDCELNEQFDPDEPWTWPDHNAPYKVDPTTGREVMNNDNDRGCQYDLGDEECYCGAAPTAIQEALALYAETPPGWKFIPPHLFDNWAYALDRYCAGFTALYHHKESGDPWSSSCWRRLSPFSSLRQLDALTQALWNRSDESPKRHAS